MSQRFTQDWEAAPSSPWSLSGIDIARTNSSPMEGSWDVRLATGAGGAVWILDLQPPNVRIYANSRRGTKLQARFTFKRHSGPTGGQAIWVFLLSNFQGLVIPNATTTLRLNSGGVTFTDGTTTLTADQQYLIDLDMRWEKDSSVWFRCWLDGVLEIEHRAAGAGDFTSVTAGNNSGKGASNARWGDVAVWVGQDPS